MRTAMDVTATRSRSRTNCLFANGLLLWKDGVLVTTDGQVLFLRDTDGDGQADEA